MARSFEQSSEPSLAREIPFGESRSAPLPYPNNTILTRRYSGWSFLPRTLLCIFQHCAYLWLLLVSAVDAVELAVEDQGGGNWATLAVFALAVLIALTRKALVEAQREATDRHTNSVLCRVWSGQDFAERRSGSVQCGDLLLVSNAEALVADVVLLTTEHPDGYCYVDSSQTLGSAELTLKRSVSEVQRYAEASTIERLTTALPRVRGMIRTATPSQDFRAFQGSLRLSRAPAAVPLSMDNFLFRGSRMYGSGWILCCVVGTGMQTKVMLNSLASIESSSRLEVVLERYCYCAVAVMVLLIVGNIVGFAVSSRDGSLVWSVVYFISLIHRLIPAPLLLFTELISLLQTFFANHFLKSSLTIQLNSFTSASHFGQIDYIIADKNCAFTLGSPLVHTLIYGDKLFGQCSGYHSGTHSCSESLRRNKHKAVLISDVPAILTRTKAFNDSNCAFTSMRSKVTEDVQEPPCGFRTLETMVLSGDSEDLVSCFECIVLCNTVTQLEPLKARNKFEEALITFARRAGVKLLESYEDRTLLEFPNRRQVYKILASSDYSSVRGRERVLVEQLGVPSGKLLVKGGIETIGPLLDIEEELFDQIKSSELQLKQSGLVPILLACKVIPEEELDLVKDQIWKAQSSIISVHQKLESLFQDLEQGLHYLGVVCIEDTIVSDTAEGVSKLNLSGTKLWVVSNDSEMESMASCMRSGYFLEDAYIVPIKKLADQRDCQRRLANLATEFIYRKPLISSWADEASALLNTPRTLRVMPSLERLISNMGENTQRKNSYRDLLSMPFDPSGINFMLMIDGISFETGLKEEDTQKLLAALLFTARSVCFFNMLPHQKAKVVRFLRHSFSFSPSVLTFADGLSSIPMLNESDLKVGLVRTAASQSRYLFDAKVTSLNALADFLVTVGRSSYRRMRHVTLFLLYENAVLATMVVIYAGLSGFTGQSPLSLMCVWAVTTIATKPLILYVGLFAEDVSREVAVEMPQIYRWQARPIVPMVFVKTLILAIFHGTFLSIIAFIGLSSCITPRGYTENVLSQSGSLVLMLFLSINGHICAAVQEKGAFFWVFQLFGCCLFTLEMILFNYTYDPLLGFLDMTVHFPSLLLRLSLAPLFVYASSFAVSLQRHRFHKSLYQFLQTTSLEITRIAHFANNLSKVWTPSKFWAPPTSDNAFERNLVWGTYRSHSVEENYQTSILPELIRHIQAGFCVLVLALGSVVIMALIESSTPNYHVLRVLVVCFCALLLALTCFPLYQRHFRLVNCTCVLVLSISLGVYQVLSGYNSSEVAISLPLFFFLSFPNSFGLVLLCSAANLVVFAVTGVFNVLLPAETTLDGVMELIRLILIVTGVTVASGLAGYFLDHLNREKFRLLTTKETELEKVDNVLKYLLPEFVRARVKDGVRFIAEVQPNVHIVFCELCRFDKMIKDYDAVEITSLLNNIYEKFDEISEGCGVTKVETVGKVYMACAGVKENQESINPKLTNVSLAQRVLYFAFELISAMDQFRLADGEPVRIKVGIHSGKVIAGVVGSHKPQFSLVGDTVNTASRMCSTVEEENSVQMSSMTYDLVKGMYGVHFDRKMKNIKGKGLMEVYVAWKDIGSRNFREDMDAPDISPLKTHQNSPALPRGLTLARRNSVFEGNIAPKQPEILKKPLWRRCFPLKLVTTKFTSEILTLHKPLALAGLTTVLILAVLNTVLEIGIYQGGVEGWQCLVFSVVLCVELAALLVLTWLTFTRRWFAWVALGLLLLTIVCQFGAVAYSDETEVSSQFGFVILLVLAAIHFTGMRSSQLLPFILVVVVLTVVRFAWLLQTKEANFRLACSIGELASFLIYVLYRDARIEKYFELKQAVTAEIEKTDNLLQNLLPQHILDNMKLERAITDHLEETTLLVADIVGFTAWSNEREPSEVIEMLSNLFSEFDQLCLKHKAYKVYTIGDCYIAMGYWDRESERNPGLECRNIVLMAEDMKKVIAQVNDDYFTDLNMRIGVHTGEIIGAMVGTNIVRYDIYGRDVLIAFKMEANSKPGEINLSAASRNLLEQTAPSEFQFEHNTIVDISAIGAKVPCFLTRPCT